MDKLRDSFSLSMNSVVVSQVCSGPIRSARSLVMNPASTVSTQTRSRVLAKVLTSGVPSNRPRKTMGPLRTENRG